MVRKARKIPYVMTAEETEKLFKQPSTKCPTGLRNLCILTLMNNVGLRVSEALSIKIKDIDWIRGKLTVVQGKGKKDRVLWLSEKDLGLLQKWREKRKIEVDLLFTTLQGEKINPRYIREYVKRIARKAGIEHDIHPHTLRHTFATDIYKDTKNIRLVQKALGHSDLSTTMIYTHIVDDELEQAMKNLRKGSQ